MTARRVDRPWRKNIPHQGRRSVRAVVARPSISSENHLYEIACSPFRGFLQSSSVHFYLVGIHNTLVLEPRASIIYPFLSETARTAPTTHLAKVRISPFERWQFAEVALVQS